MIAVCGGSLTAGSRASEFYSHAKYGDMNYDSRMDCNWLIIAEDRHHRVRVHFKTFETEPETDCG